MQFAFEECDIVFERLREVGFGAAAGEVLVPARELHILRLHIAFEAEGKLRGQFAVDLICRAGFDGLEGVEHIGLHHDELGNTIEHDGIAQRDKVYPTTAAFATRYGTELMPYATHGCPRLVK